MKEDCPLETVKEVVGGHMPDAFLHTSQGGELTFKLPPTTSLFAPLLEDLTTRKEELGVKHVGLSLTTMERVFIR